MESLKLSYIAVQNINGTTVWWLDKFTQLKQVSHELPIPLLCVFPREKKIHTNIFTKISQKIYS